MCLSGPWARHQRPSLNDMSARALTVLVLVSALGLAANYWSENREPPTEAEITAKLEQEREEQEAELAQERQEQFDKRLQDLRAAELEGWTVAPINEPIIQDWLTTWISPLYLEGGLCTDVTMESRSAIPQRIDAKDWGFITPDNPGIQGRIWGGDALVGGDVRGNVVIPPRGRREFQVCATNFNAAKKLTYPPPPGVYQIEHNAPVGGSYKTTHVWLTSFG